MAEHWVGFSSPSDSWSGSGTPPSPSLPSYLESNGNQMKSKLKRYLEVSVVNEKDIVGFEADQGSFCKSI